MEPGQAKRDVSTSLHEHSRTVALLMGLTTAGPAIINFEGTRVYVCLALSYSLTSDLSASTDYTRPAAPPNRRLRQWQRTVTATPVYQYTAGLAFRRSVAPLHEDHTERSRGSPYIQSAIELVTSAWLKVVTRAGAQMPARCGRLLGLLWDSHQVPHEISGR